jgi:hypothetical protein
MSLEDRIAKERVRLHRRKRNRDRKRKRGEGHKAKREAAAVRTIRARIRAALDIFHSSPRTMFDDTTVQLIPKSAKAVAGYVNGRYRTWARVLHRFPHARHISIAVSADVLADCLDVESGDATNQEAVGWYHRFKADAKKNKTPHKKPIFYTSVSNADALVATLRHASIRRGSYILWTAHYGDGKHVCGPKTCGLTRHQADSTQWTSSSHSRSLDESRCKPSFWERG